MAHTVIGTAGHIDHGKTLLVKALTGMDTDQAPEERARGITIELGFAFLGDQATIIDVPGHERFVKTMVAGVSTIDVAMLVIAADDGVMPQSREHLDVLRLLGVERGVVVINKADFVRPGNARVSTTWWKRSGWTWWRRRCGSLCAGVFWRRPRSFASLRSAARALTHCGSSCWPWSRTLQPSTRMRHSACP